MLVLSLQVIVVVMPWLLSAAPKPLCCVLGCGKPNARNGSGLLSGESLLISDGVSLSLVVTRLALTLVRRGNVLVRMPELSLLLLLRGSRCLMAVSLPLLVAENTIARIGTLPVALVLFRVCLIPGA